MAYSRHLDIFWQPLMKGGVRSVLFFKGDRLFDHPLFGKGKCPEQDSPELHLEADFPVEFLLMGGRPDDFRHPVGGQGDPQFFNG